MIILSCIPCTHWVHLNAQAEQCCCFVSKATVAMNNEHVHFRDKSQPEALSRTYLASPVWWTCTWGAGLFLNTYVCCLWQGCIQVTFVSQVFAGNNTMAGSRFHNMSLFQHWRLTLLARNVSGWNLPLICLTMIGDNNCMVKRALYTQLMYRKQEALLCLSKPLVATNLLWMQGSATSRWYRESQLTIGQNVRFQA